MRSVRFATLGSHKFITDILKLNKTPTCTSRQPLRGKIIGAIEQAGDGRTYTNI